MNRVCPYCAVIQKDNNINCPLREKTPLLILAVYEQIVFYCSVKLNVDKPHGQCINLFRY